ncbi:AAA domain-containing protein [archaeon]|jgi:ATP-dependent Clp protease ATP-binding subunit ClpX|nr:AAA domain-containing protein [archaeon]MBT3451373.1 AAA domain-containing protein [archaeon]MBT6868493.1 AAA domain-containing protein [archaeon]MBT7193592.1 AAA domain-containing protein [archaeon]MBT7381305.1 AAA domain-containing protein [archaeon]
MDLFTSKYTERESDLELVIQGLLHSDDVNFQFELKGKEGDEKYVNSSVYLLPLELYDGMIHGIFKFNDKINEVPIGLTRKMNFLNVNHYLPCLNGSLTKENLMRTDRIYLPLKLTEFMMAIGSTKDGKFVPNENAPFSIYGVDGKKGILPLIFVSENEDGLYCRGIYKSKKEGVVTYRHNGMRDSDSDIIKVIQEFKGSKFIPGSAKKELVANASSHEEDKKEPMALIESFEEIDWEKPRSITNYLDRYVIGQVEAKKIVAVAFSNYMTKVRTESDELAKDNLLLIGPSGVGKTYMISLLAKEASLPIVQSKLTGKTTEGYKGENLSVVLEQMRSKTDGEEPYGIVFLDEIDKLAGDYWGSGPGFGARLQDELIGWLEDATVANSDSKKLSSISTKNLLFVTAGAFQGLGEGNSLLDIISKRLGSDKRQIGFGISSQQVEEKDTSYVLSKARPEDLMTYGLKPELIGRLTSIGILNYLSNEDKIRILTEARNTPLRNYYKLLELKGYELDFDESVPDIIVSYCPEETGARALNAICNDLFSEILYEPSKYADENKVILVTPEMAREFINLYG